MPRKYKNVSKAMVTIIVQVIKIGSKTLRDVSMMPYKAHLDSTEERLQIGLKSWDPKSFENCNWCLKTITSTTYPFTVNKTSYLYYVEPIWNLVFFSSSYLLHLIQNFSCVFIVFLPRILGYVPSWCPVGLLSIFWK